VNIEDEVRDTPRNKAREILTTEWQEDIAAVNYHIRTAHTAQEIRALAILKGLIQQWLKAVR
jgi:hypothetical protein